MMALATRYDVSAQVDSSTVAERLPAMCGSDTFTTVVSSTSMKVANMTATATIHGLTWRCSGMSERPGAPRPEPYFVYTVTVADNPGLSWWSGSAPGSKPSFTGT